MIAKGVTDVVRADGRAGLGSHGHRNPLENIKNTNSIRYVMKNGELYEGDTLNMVWPQARPLPKQFWWGNTTEGSGRADADGEMTNNE
ncbi:MAG: hypothetical protein WD690_17635 [Vicinamibacterales bacterium]